MDVPSNQYEDLADSDIIVVAGLGCRRKKGRLIKFVGAKRKNHSLNDKGIGSGCPSQCPLVSNPVDVLTRIAIASSRAENLILGSELFLILQLKYQLGKRLNVDKQEVHVYVIGEHGDSEFTAWSSAFIGSIPLDEFLSPR